MTIEKLVKRRYQTLRRQNFDKDKHSNQKETTENATPATTSIVMLTNPINNKAFFTVGRYKQNGAVTTYKDGGLPETVCFEVLDSKSLSSAKGGKGRLHEKLLFQSLWLP